MLQEIYLGPAVAALLWGYPTIYPIILRGKRLERTIRLQNFLALAD